MTIQEAIDAARKLRDTDIDDKQLVMWLDAHDQALYDRTLAKYGADKHAHPYVNLPYGQFWDDDPTERDLDVELILPDKYGLDIYPDYLVMRIDLQHGDYERYNNDAMLYGDLLQRMLDDITRDNRWKPPKPADWPDCAPWDGRIYLKF